MCTSRFDLDSLWMCKRYKRVALKATYGELYQNASKLKTPVSQHPTPQTLCFSAYFSTDHYQGTPWPYAENSEPLCTVRWSLQVRLFLFQRGRGPGFRGTLWSGCVRGSVSSSVLPSYNCCANSSLSLSFFFFPFSWSVCFCVCGCLWESVKEGKHEDTQCTGPL